MNNLKIIAIEGIDGSGKTTIANILSEQLGMLYIKTPDTPFNLIRKYYDESSCDPIIRMHFYIGCLWDVFRKSERAHGFNGIILDRYTLSTIAYHSVLCGNNHDVKKIINISAPPAADMNIFLKTGIKTAQCRINKRAAFTGYDSELEKDIELQKKVSALLEDLSDVTILNENRTVSDTTEECKHFIKKLLL